MRRHKKGILIFLGCCVLIGAGGLYYLKTSPSAFAAGMREAVGAYVSQMSFPHRPDFAKKLTVTGETVFVDGTAGTMPDIIADRDVKVVYDTPEGQVFCDYAAGFSLALPSDMAPDMSCGPKYISFTSPSAKLVISKEWSYDEDVSAYIAYYFNRFLLNDAWRKQNNIELLENTVSGDIERLTVRLNGYDGGFDTYTHLNFKTDSRFFFHAMLKYGSGDAGAQGLVTQIQSSFQFFRTEGTAKYSVQFRPVLPENWTAETRALYEKIASSDKLMWGIYTQDMNGEGITQKIPDMEDKLGYKFGLVLTYTSLDGGFPTGFMTRCSDEGRVVELTLQATVSNNQDLFGRSPWLALYKTGDDERIRAFARAAKAFGRPFLFRLNNEMNSDWVSYGGVTNLLDPDIFAANWRTVYGIFEEEGVTNAIWIFNPNDRDAPPNGWNSQTAYYPGDGYAQLYGITGYNNGTYYQKTWGESWREFDEIYNKIDAESSELFGAFPWVITEFSSSSIGGDKAKWIDGLFESLHTYPNIKAAVWFSSADYDPKDNTTVSRPYWLDETEETLAAFRRGLEKTGEIPSASG